MENSTEYVSGVYGEETDAGRKFRWLSKKAILGVPATGERYMFIELFSSLEDMEQKVTLKGGKQDKEMALLNGWGTYTVDWGHGKSLEIMSEKILVVPEDKRELCVRLGKITFGGEKSPGIVITENKIINMGEFVDGKTILSSFPVNLGIDIHGICNFRPACVYCEYDFVKTMEGKNVHLAFDKHTLEEYGPFFKNAEQMTNCSIGEPLLSKTVKEVFEEFEKNAKTVEMSTNGLLLNKDARSFLSGKNLHLYVSLDAATPETYSRLRINAFKQVVDNVRNLVKERKNKLPVVYLVFMPMHINMHELEDFFKLAADIGADAVILRPLVIQENVVKTPERSGYVFEYSKEILSFNEFIKVSKEAEEFSKKYNIRLLNQMNFNNVLDKAMEKSDVKEPSLMKAKNEIIEDKPKKAKPICDEPWKALYILRSGVKPCCYGNATIADMKDYKDAWNGPKIREIREKLAKGQLSDYCLGSQSCPIVKMYMKGKLKRPNPFYRLARYAKNKILRKI